MDIEKSRQFYQDRYYKAIRQFGSKSLTASICKKKLEMLGEKIKQQNTAESSTSTDDSHSVTNAENNKSKEKLPTD